MVSFGQRAFFRFNCKYQTTSPSLYLLTCLRNKNAEIAAGGRKALLVDLEGGGGQMFDTVSNNRAKPQQTPSVEKHAHPPRVVCCAIYSTLTRFTKFRACTLHVLALQMPLIRCTNVFTKGGYTVTIPKRNLVTSGSFRVEQSNIAGGGGVMLPRLNF